MSLVETDAALKAIPDTFQAIFDRIIQMNKASKKLTEVVIKQEKAINALGKMMAKNEQRIQELERKLEQAESYAREQLD